jgi:archaellum component FlaD/FlaE
MQAGVVLDDGPTLEEIKAEEKTAKEQEEESSEDEGDASEEALSEEAPEEETVADSVEEVQEEETSVDVDYNSMTVAQLKELLKEKGKPVSGKKADLISRLSE